jgi:hypothetical protein
MRKNFEAEIRIFKNMNAHMTTSVISIKASHVCALLTKRLKNAGVNRPFF